MKSRYCVIGSPVAHSRSPKLFDEIFCERGLSESCEYVINEIKTQAELESFFGEMRSGAWAGCNVTMPWKSEVMRYVDQATEQAKRTNCANTIRRNPDGTLSAHTTDGAGMLRAVREALTEEAAQDVKASGPRHLHELSTLILGAGGAARSIVAEMINQNMHNLRIAARSSANRDMMRALIEEEIVNDKIFIDYDDNEAIKKAVSEADLVINCTPLGMAPQENKLPIPKTAKFKDGAIVADVVYNPMETLFLKEAKKQKCICVPGIKMLEGQALEGADFFFGRRQID